MTTSTTNPRGDRVSDTLPLAPLLVLGSAAFLAIMTEAVPAGLLPAMSDGLGVGESAAGQTVTIYAVGSIVAAIPLTAATARWPRKRVLLTALAGLVATNTVTAISSSYPLTMAARLLGGVVAGVLWALMAGYARRMVTPAQRGRATAIALGGTPVALSIGVPAGTLLAGVVGWRYTFGIIGALTAAVIVCAVAVMPDFPGQVRRVRTPLRRAAARPGVLPVMATTFAFVLAHNVLYTYIAPLLAGTTLEGRVDAVLLVFGVVSLVSIWLTGVLIDRYLRNLVIVSSLLLAITSTSLAVAGEVAWAVYAASALWGLAFGGAAPLLQTSAAEAGGDDAVDAIQSLLVTTWNCGIAAGAVAGGVLLSAVGVSALSGGALALSAVALCIAVIARRHSFPSSDRRAARLRASDHRTPERIS